MWDKFKDITGQRFERLTALEFVGKDNKGKVLWKCKCDCGNEIVCRGESLRSGNTKSCGCLAREMARNHCLSMTKHGKKNTRIYNTWAEMKQRCNNRNYHGYSDYGGRGIKVCEEWQEFMPFYDWAMSHGYRDVLTLDRKDVNGDYCPENCRWATTKEQAINKRSTPHVTYHGKQYALAELIELTGIPRGRIYGAHYRGVDMEQYIDKYFSQGGKGRVILHTKWESRDK